MSDFAVAGGWLARAESLLESAQDESAERGWVELLHAGREPHGQEREGRLEKARELAKRHDDSDLAFAALALLGETRVMTGSFAQGMGNLDESLAAICGGEVRDLYVIEAVFCGMFVICERVQDVSRAEQWLRAAAELIKRRNVVAVGPLCRAHYGGLLMAAGRWPEAEAELNEAARGFEGGYFGARAIVLIRLADLRVRQGRLEEATVLLEGLDLIPDSARPLAALHLARSEPALARDVLERRLALPAMPAPWPIGTVLPLPPPVAGPLLALLVEVELASDDLDAARAAVERLEALAAIHPGHSLIATAALARGRLCNRLKQAAAEDHIRRSIEMFSLAEMPVEGARARLELARVLASERPEVATAEARQALRGFELRNAARDADNAAALLRSLGAPGRSAPRGREPLTKRESEVLELLAEGLSNPKIAERLVISRKTAEHHVGNILAKLSLSSRAEAAAYAARTKVEKPGSE